MLFAGIVFFFGYPNSAGSDGVFMAECPEPLPVSRLVSKPMRPQELDAIFEIYSGGKSGQTSQQTETALQLS